MSTGPIIDFTPEDLKRNLIVDPGWYRIRIGEFKEVPTKDGESTNYVFEDTEILENADTGDTKFSGVRLRLLFSAKPTAKGFILGLFQALGGEVDPVTGGRMRISDAQGKEVIAMVETNIYQGNASNRINHRYKKIPAA